MNRNGAATTAVLLILILVIWAYSIVSPPIVLPDWVKDIDLRRIRRYHGTNALRITEKDIAIWREQKQKWIVVERR